MQLQRIEARVLDIVDAVVQGGRVEDDRVEAKRQWPTDHRKAARQIAGLANSASGEPILWIVGLDEDDHRVTPGHDTEPSNWWSKVSSRFSDVPPDLKLIRVPTPHGAVAALWMETGRTPYVVTTNGEGGVDREVPWRAGTALRSAHRHEILRSVIGEAEAPQIDPIDAWLRATTTAVDTSNLDATPTPVPPQVTLHYELAAYVEVFQAVRLPEHRWTLRLVAGGREFDLAMNSVIGPQVAESSTGMGFPRFAPVGSITYVAYSGLHVNGSDSISIRGETTLPDPGGELAKLFKHARRLDLAAQFPIAASSRETGLNVTLRRSTPVPISKSNALAYRKVDERVGEFTFGGVAPRWYEGRTEKAEKVTG